MPDAASAAVQTSSTATFSDPKLDAELEDAEQLLNYVIETGKSIDDAVYRAILEARRSGRAGWTEDVGVNLYKAVRALTEAAKPVTVESMKFSVDAKNASKTIRWYPIAGVLAMIVIIWSATAWVTSELAGDIRKNLEIANPLAVSLMDKLGNGDPTDAKPCQIESVSATRSDTIKPGPVRSAQSALTQSKTTIQKPVVSVSDLPSGIKGKDVLEDLQKFAIAIRGMYGDAQRISLIYRYVSLGIKHGIDDPFKHLNARERHDMLELPPGLPNLAQAATERTCVLQRVRFYAQSSEQAVTLFSGAITTCILPMLYALLGAFAYLLRKYELDVKARVLTRSNTLSAHLITAAIAGTVVGLFNFGDKTSVSPLAIAFLAGFAVNMFFAFLETTIDAFSRQKDREPSRPSRK
jgi:hypothetical protein